jgi:hypothetical protein
MIPMFVVLQLPHVSWFSHGRIWIPIFLIWMIVFPIIILFSPIIFIFCLTKSMNPISGVKACFELLSALRGLEIDVQDQDQQIYISIK